MKKTIFIFFYAILCMQTFSQQRSLQGLTYGKIPIDPKRWYQLNNASTGLDQLFDGILTVRPNTGWGKILQNYDSYYPANDGEQINIDSIKMYDWEGVMSTYPVTIYAITNTWQRIKIASFTGEQYARWVGPYPERPDVFKLDSSIKNIKYLVLNSWYEYPTEIEFYGSYKAGKAVAPLVKKPVKLKDFFGVNGFEWDFEDGASPWKLDEARVNAVKSFSGFRHLMDWNKLESNEGSYTYNPVHSGGWNYDTMYARCKTEGIEVLACLKTLPPWMLATYPADQQDVENTPVKYGSNFEDPNAYKQQARVAFQYIARYGNNTNVNPALLSVNDSARWFGDDINQIKIGLGLIKYIECDNERDKWWKGRKAYQTGREYAANLSAFYDGNKNTMGAGIGVKNADSTVMVVMGGVASTTTDYVRGMIDWCKEFRGYKTDGTVNFCWDIINYHIYPSNADSTANGYPTRGMAPEVSKAANVANDFVNMAHQYANDMPVWVTETGYDDNIGSPYHALAIGNKTIANTKADWILRTALLYARQGIQKCFFYETYDDQPGTGNPYGTCGLLNPDRTRKPAADFLYQTKKLFGDYTYKQTLKANPIVDRYELNGNSMYVLLVPDETGRTDSYLLNIGTSEYADIYTPKAGSDNMDVKRVYNTSGKIKVNVTETPVFVVPSVPMSFAFVN